MPQFKLVNIVILAVILAIGGAIGVLAIGSPAGPNRTVNVDCGGGKDVYLPKGQKLVSTSQTSFTSHEVICNLKPRRFWETPMSQARYVVVDIGSDQETRLQCTIHDG